MTPLVHVVDDDPRFRESLRSLLESDKLAVATYRDTADFLERYIPEQPGCLLVDIRQPGTSGLRLAEELLRRGIRMPTVLIAASGEVDDEALLRRVRGALIGDAVARDVSRRIALLNAREIDVLARVIDGKPNKAIAEELGIAVKMIEFHRRRIMHKLRAKTVADLIRFGARHRIAGRHAPS
jgi:two-component system response regulator FixJ